MTAECMSYDLSDLWAAYSATRGERERNALTEHYLYLAKMVARRFSGRGVDYDDLLQTASVALIGAIERFDGKQGVSFVTYAAPTLAGAVRNYFRDKSRVMRLPRRHAELYVRLRDTRDSLTASLGREPSVSEIAAAMGITEETVLDVVESRYAASALSLDTPAADTDEGEPLTLGNAVGVEESGYDRVEERDLLSRALAALPSGDRKLLTLRFTDERSQRETARHMNTSQMRVSRMERRLLETLRKEILDD